MSFVNAKTRKSDNELDNHNPESFIPIACHYDDNTLLSKNGELIQIIQINGINSDHISENLVKLRDVVRKSINNNVKDGHFAFWIHTVRNKTNLDDMTPYPNLFSANLHNMWRKKNYWDDKYVNTLYISIVHDAAKLKINSFAAFINSLSFSGINHFQRKYWEYSAKNLNNTVNGILKDLEDFGADKLGIVFNANKSYSELMFLYRKIVNLYEAQCLVPVSDISSSLSASRYVVGGDKIEVVDVVSKNFTAILSLKEYHEVSADALDKFLQLPIELIATEVFYLIDKKAALPFFGHQNYILNVSGDKNLRQIKGLDEVFDANESGDKNFCNQQISIAIISNSIKELEEDVKIASNTLSQIGIVHVREDINLEHTFWAQLPGNFQFLRRVSPNLVSRTAALASLHNFPTGLQYNKWGKAVTLLRTEKATPYFMNIHSDDNGGHVCIFGSSGVGKTVITNFLISESTKFKPTILYFTNNDDSKVFCHAINGTWYSSVKNLLNPFLLLNQNHIKEFLNIICSDIQNSNSDATRFLNNLLEQIITLPPENRNFKFILSNIDFTEPGGEIIKGKLSIFGDGGSYADVFSDNSTFNLLEGSCLAININEFTDAYYTDKFYPDDKKLLTKFTENLKVNSRVRAALIYALTNIFLESTMNPKIIAFDNIHKIYDFENYSSLYVGIFRALKQNNCVAISNMNLSDVQKWDPKAWDVFSEFIDTKIILPSEINISKLGQILELSKIELDRLSKLNVSSRMFLIKSKNRTIAAELSIGVFDAILRILSSKSVEIKICEDLLKQGLEYDDFVDKLYHAFVN